MRFMMLMIPKGCENAAPDTMPGPKAVAAMTKYNKTLQEAGVLLSCGCGLSKKTVNEHRSKSISK